MLAHSGARAAPLLVVALALALALALVALVPARTAGQEPVAATAEVYPEMPAGRPPRVDVENAEAADEAAMKPYREVVPGVDATFEMVPIRGGRFVQGSPESEPERKADEGPQAPVELEPFWIGRCEVTWDEYQPFMLKLDVEDRRQGRSAAAPQDAHADAVSRPTPPYVPMDFEMGTKGFPAICMTQFAARQYTKWLTMKTGRFYRLPTESEWEYACRAGSTTAYSFGDDVAALGDHAWYFDNADDRYHPVGTKAPNPWGLHDMHGNVAEWVIDRHDPAFYATLLDPSAAAAVAPIAWPSDLYPHVVRGGSFDDDADRLRSAARRGSTKAWKVQDPQMPKSIWYHTDARFVGFRVVRPLREPPPEEQAKFHDPDVEEIARILDKQRRGGR
jgi:formylglycine-generating enzyme required for sulfatase activity